MFKLISQFIHDIANCCGAPYNVYPNIFTLANPSYSPNAVAVILSLMQMVIRKCLNKLKCIARLIVLFRLSDIWDSVGENHRLYIPYPGLETG